MTATARAFSLDQYRGYLLLLARAEWDAVLRCWGDPSDLVHQTLLEAQQKLGAFQGTSPAQFAGWLRKMLTNNLFDLTRALRRKKRDYRKKTSIEAALDESSARLGSALAQDDPSPSQRAVAAERLNLLADALARLPPEQGEAVTLHHLRGLSVGQTAAAMNRTRASVAGLLRRGLKELGGLLRERESP